MRVMADPGPPQQGEVLLARVRCSTAGLASLRADHLRILDSLHAESSGRPAADRESLKQRTNAVTEQLQQLELGLAEGGLMLALAHQFDTLEAERSVTRLEMRRVKDENDWLREELEDTERRLQEALAKLAELEVQETQREFENQVQNINSLLDNKKIEHNLLSFIMFIFYIDKETGNRSKCETNDTVKDSRWKLQVSIQ